MAAKEFRFVLGRGGWVWLRHPAVGAVDLSLRVDDRRGRLTIVDLIVRPRDGRAVDANLLREIPTGEIEQVLNRPDIAELFRQRIATDGGTIEAETDDALGRLVPADPGDVLTRPPLALLRIRGIAAKRKPDTFYERVAHLISLLAPFEESPAERIADANGVDTEIVYRWVKEARRRGLLAPARRGGMS